MMATYNNAPAPGGDQYQLPPHEQYQQFQRVQQQQQQYETQRRGPQASGPSRQPQQQQQQQPPRAPMHQTPSSANQDRRSRTFSLRSDKSHKSSNSRTKFEPESHAEKEAKRLHSKADPTMAISEAEPSAVALEKSSLAPLRSLVHRDNMGNPISEPDRSNPTRYRWERPLETIRSFEAAIDGAYNNRDTESIAPLGGNNRRNSYYANNARYPQDTYYGRQQSYMPSQGSQYDLRQTRDTYYESGGYNGYNGYNNGGYGQNGGRPRYSRMGSEPPQQQQQGQYHRQNDQNVYPQPNNHRSYETVASGSGSGTSGDPAGYQTDPTSSDNSSIERRQSPPKGQQRKPEPMNDYGIGFQAPSYQTPGFSVTPPKPAPIQLSSSRPPAGGAAAAAPPPPPAKTGLMRKNTNKLTAAPHEKRKSFFKRFSKADH